MLTRPHTMLIRPHTKRGRPPLLGQPPAKFGEANEILTGSYSEAFGVRMSRLPNADTRRSAANTRAIPSPGPDYSAAAPTKIWVTLPSAIVNRIPPKIDPTTTVSDVDSSELIRPS